MYQCRRLMLATGFVTERREDDEKDVAPSDDVADAAVVVPSMSLTLGGSFTGGKLGSLQSSAFDVSVASSLASPAAPRLRDQEHHLSSSLYLLL